MHELAYNSQNGAQQASTGRSFFSPVLCKNSVIVTLATVSAPSATRVATTVNTATIEDCQFLECCHYEPRRDVRTDTMPLAELMSYPMEIT